MWSLPFPLYNNTVRKILILFFHLLVVIFAFVDAFALRFDLSIPTNYWPVIVDLVPAVVILKIMVFWSMGLTEG
jgi:hypothetical protein